jgi:hypothetical protein
MCADRRRGAIARATCGAVFIATPNVGSVYATLANGTGGASKITEELAKDGPWLRYLDERFANKSPSFGWDTRAFSEILPMTPRLVVSPSSAISRAAHCSACESIDDGSF